MQSQRFTQAESSFVRQKPTCANLIVSVRLQGNCLALESTAMPEVARPLGLRLKRDTPIKQTPLDLEDALMTSIDLSGVLLNEVEIPEDGGVAIAEAI